MKVKDALNLLDGNKVFIDYTPNPEHGDKVYCAGLVDGDYKNAKVQRNAYNVEYISVSVRYMGKRSVFPSFCLSKI